MMMKIYKSQIPGDFDQQVSAYINELKEWRSLVDVPRPTASPFIEGAVKRVNGADNGMDDFVADYEIIDDTPSAEEQKAIAINESRQQENAEVDALIPPGKRRLLEMDYSRAASVPEKDRTPQQASAVTTYLDLKAQENDVRYAGAQREAAIEDAQTQDERTAILSAVRSR